MARKGTARPGITIVRIQVHPEEESSDILLQDYYSSNQILGAFTDSEN
jgi:hypothetical protein